MRERATRFLRRAWRWARRQPGVQATAARLGIPTADTFIPEVTPIRPRPSALRGMRLNLMVPTVRGSHTFGGIATALQFFEALRADDVDARIILTDDDFRGEAIPAGLEGWTLHAATDDDAMGRIIVPHASRADVKLPVREGDIFVATAWWTAYLAQRIVPWQASHYDRPMHSLVYLVQDHEPDFYPLSSRHQLATSTYAYPGPMDCVFNTSLLRDFFAHRGYRFTREYVFEPQLNPGLAAVRQDLGDLAKERLLVMYGRPGVARNAFELVCQGVREWSLRDPHASAWRIESLGELHQDVILPNGGRIISRGKLTLEQYAQTLLRAGAGISLMLSPHPSYPPLEMAEFGVRVLTNRHENKDLSTRSEFIDSLDTITPEAIADALERLTAPWRQSAQVPVTLPTASLFAPQGAAFPFVPAVRGAIGFPPAS